MVGFLSYRRRLPVQAAPIIDVSVADKTVTVRQAASGKAEFLVLCDPGLFDRAAPCVGDILIVSGAKRRVVTPGDFQREYVPVLVTV